MDWIAVGITYLLFVAFIVGLSYAIHPPEDVWTYKCPAWYVTFMWVYDGISAVASVMKYLVRS